MALTNFLYLIEYQKCQDNQNNGLISALASKPMIKIFSKHRILFTKQDVMNRIKNSHNA